MSRADGYRAGTNYNHKIGRWRIDPDAEVRAALAQDLACQRGEHDEVVARPGYVTYAGGRRVEPGTGYCRRCKVPLTEARDE